MIKYNVLIVEDEPKIAEFHVDLLNHSQAFSPIGVASSIKEARSMFAILKPDLIILDNYLPDGTGIDFMKYIASNDSPQNVIFITAANDIATVNKAVRLGCFDYLLKPISYSRLEDSLQRFANYMSTLKSTDLLSQRYVDAILNYQSKSNVRIEDLPKGIDAITLDKVKDVFIKPEITHTSESLASAAHLSKTTARRYLEYCAIAGFLDAEIRYGNIGRPERLYRKKVSA